MRGGSSWLGRPGRDRRSAAVGGRRDGVGAAPRARGQASAAALEIRGHRHGGEGHRLDLDGLGLGGVVLALADAEHEADDRGELVGVEPLGQPLAAAGVPELDQEVRDYVEAGTMAGEFYGRLLPLLEFLIPAYVAEGKSHLTIAIGCTGGRHRSITVAERIWREFSTRDDVKVRVTHRDIA